MVRLILLVDLLYIRLLMSFGLFGLGSRDDLPKIELDMEERGLKIYIRLYIRRGIDE